MMSSLRSRAALVAASAAVLGATVAAPAVASSDGTAGNAPDRPAQATAPQAQRPQQAPQAGQPQQAPETQQQVPGAVPEHSRYYRGEVVARRGVWVRTGPSTRYRKVRLLRYHTHFNIACKVKGENVAGNNRWYRLPGRGPHVYVTARYVSNIGPAPHWC